MSHEKITLSFCETYHTRDGLPLYPQRYIKVLSFHHTTYGDIAPVYDSVGAFFIDMQGQKVFTKTFIKAFGFYEGLACVVRDSNEVYFHINSQGKRIYTENFAYVGDYKYGIAVAVLESGKCVHIFTNGARVHNKAFVELDFS